MEVTPVPAARRLFVSAVAAAVLVAPTAAHANSAPPKGLRAKATVALGDKRPPKATAAQGCANTDVIPAPQTIELVRAAVLCLHNQIRAQHDLPLLKDNRKLRKAAAGHATDMVQQGYFDHVSPYGETFVERILGAGYVKRADGWALGENLAWGTGEQSTAAGVMRAWMSSPGHKANLLKRSYEEIGIGVRLGVPSDDGVGATFTAEFGAKA
jgi:uncharacterized protein YkwD